MLSLDDASNTNRCRICEKEIEFKGRPVGWKTDFYQVLWPVHIILDFGREFAHASCLERPNTTNNVSER